MLISMLWVVVGDTTKWNHAAYPRVGDATQSVRSLTLPAVRTVVPESTAPHSVDRAWLQSVLGGDGGVAAVVAVAVEDGVTVAWSWNRVRPNEPVDAP